jgi:predicted small lipoprotein YifL
MVSRRWLKRISNGLVGGLVGLLLVVLLSVPGLAQTGSKLPIPEQQPLNLPDLEKNTPSGQTELTDPQELEGFIDPILEKEIAKSTTPGAVVSIVKDGRFFAQR